MNVSSVLVQETTVPYLYWEREGLQGGREGGGGGGGDTTFEGEKVGTLLQKEQFLFLKKKK